MFRIISVLMLSLTVLAVWPCASLAAPIKIGLSVPLTGPAATYGMDIKNTILFANEELGKGRYEFIIEDDRCSPREAASIAHKFVADSAIKFVLGLPCSGPALSAAPIYERGQKLVFAFASAPELSNSGEYIFRGRPSDSETAVALAGLVAGRHNRIGILAEQTDYAQAIKEALLGEFAVQGKQAFSEDYLSDTADFRAVLLRLKSRNIEGLVIVSQSEQTAALPLKQLRELTLELPIYGSNAMVSPTFLELAGIEAEGVVVVALPPVDSVLTAAGKKIYAKYLAKYGSPKSVDYFFYSAFEAFRAMDAALMSPADPRHFLSTGKFNGIFGAYSFNEHGDMVGVAPLARLIRSRKFEPVEPRDP